MTYKSTPDKKRYWISWVEESEDYRPLTDPPNEHILGWWRSGYVPGDELRSDKAILCALVQAPSLDGAFDAIGVDWPCDHPREWRIYEGRPNTHVPSSRFPLSAWMKERCKPPV